MDIPEKICDAHLHFGAPEPLKAIADNSPLKERFPCYRTVEFDRMDDYQARFDEHHVWKTVLIPFVFRELDKDAESLFVISQAQKDPEHFYPYALLNEASPDFAENHYQEIVGLKEHIVMHQTVLTDTRKIIFEMLQAHGLTLLIHTYAEPRIQYVTDIVKNFPRLKIQIAHMGRAKPGVIPFMLNIIDAVRSFENVTFDTSTVRESIIVTEAVKRIGAERILYGSDFPFFMDETGTEDIMEKQILHVLGAEITNAQKEQIFFKNFDHWITYGRQIAD